MLKNDSIEINFPYIMIGFICSIFNNNFLLIINTRQYNNNRLLMESQEGVTELTSF
jgi:hypothetical protein